jgi:hypothetical protein
VPLFGPASERDACGIGFVADSRGRASREIVDCLLEGLHNVRHRGATAADRKTGDGAGVLLPLPPDGPKWFGSGGGGGGGGGLEGGGGGGVWLE